MTARALLGKLAATLMADVRLPTIDRRDLTLSRYSEPDADQRLLLTQLRLQLPTQPPPRIVVTSPHPLPAQATV